MFCKSIEARPNWRDVAQELGYLSTIMADPPYWVEALDKPFCVVFSKDEVEDLILPATREIVAIARQTLEEIVNGPRSKEYFDRLKTPVRWREAIKESWRRQESNLRGRLDFSYSNGALKLLELNFDGAVSLYEASIFQRQWLDELLIENKFPLGTGQSNSVHERLIEAFARLIPEDQVVHFTSLGTEGEEDDTVRYMQSCALLAGKKTAYLKLKSLGYDADGRLIDLKDEVISNLVKLYPWELLFREDRAIAEKAGQSVLLPLVEKGLVKFFEPVWSSLLSNKAILTVMCELFPQCPYLLKSALEGSEESEIIKKTAYARKPLFGMQGANVSLIYPDEPQRDFVMPGAYGKEGFIVQQLHPLPQYENYHLLVGSWVIDNHAAGIGLRADISPVTTGSHCLFVPHVIDEQGDIKP